MESNIRKLAYERYQLDWMRTHGHSIAELVKELKTYAEDADPNETIEEIFENWANDAGFGGEIWVCYDEFLDCEYRDSKYICKLLSKSESDLYAIDVVEMSMPTANS